MIKWKLPAWYSSVSFSKIRGKKKKTGKSFLLLGSKKYFLKIWEKEKRGEEEDEKEEPGRY